MSSPLSTPDIEKEEDLDEAKEGEQQEEKEPPFRVLIHKEVGTVDELDQTVDQLIDASASDRPFTIELSVTNETSRAIVTGREDSHVEFYDASRL